MTRIRWSRDAQADLAAIDDYYHDLDPGFAHRVGSQAIAAARLLAQHPQAGPSAEASPTRKWSVAKTPYILLYQLRAGEVRIVRVVHHAQDWQKSL